jgi:hypothetical protein
VCDDAPDEPRYRLELALLLRRSGADEAARSLLSALADDPALSSTVRGEALVELAAAAVDGDRPAAAALLDRAAALPLDDDARRQVEARRFALAHAGPAGPALRDYFFAHPRLTGPDPVVLAVRAARATAAEPTLGLGYYLLGFVGQDRGAPADAAHALRTALALGLPHPLLTRACAGQLAAAAFLAGDHDGVRAAAAVLGAADQPEVVRLEARDWLERLEFAETGRLGPPTSR